VYVLLHEVVVDVRGHSLQMTMEQLLAVIFKLTELSQINVAQVMFVHDEFEHAQGQVDLPQMVQHSAGNEVHSLHVIDFGVQRGIFHEELLKCLFEVAKVFLLQRNRATVVK